jgi:hypothetical protein
MPEGVPPNAGYMVAAYVVCAALLVGYALSLYLRIRKLRSTGSTGGLSRPTSGGTQPS